MHPELFLLRCDGQEVGKKSLQVTGSFHLTKNGGIEE
jgi:hypothetical protein